MSHFLGTLAVVCYFILFAALFSGTPDQVLFGMLVVALALTVLWLIATKMGQRKPKEVEEIPAGMVNKPSPQLFPLFVLALVLIVFFASSCTKNGYGCHGNSKCMTRVR